MSVNELKHTPGPWRVGASNGANANMVFVDEDVEPWRATAVCMVYGLPINTRADEITDKYAEGVATSHLIAAAPELLAALEGLEMLGTRMGEGGNERFERVADAFYRERGMLAPGKSEPAETATSGSYDIRVAEYENWIIEKYRAARDAIAKARRKA